MTDRLSISRAWDETKARFGSDGRLLFAVALALVALPAAIAIVVAPPEGLAAEAPPRWTAILTIIVALVGIVGQLAIVRLGLGGSVKVGDAIAHGATRMPIVLLALILLGIALLLVMIPLLVLVILLGGGATDPKSAAAPVAGLLVILALAASPKFQMILPVVAAESVGPIAMLKRSWTLSNGRYWRLLGFVLLLALMAVILLVPAQLVGGLVASAIATPVEPFSLGALVFGLFAGIAQAIFVVIASLMLARIYVQLAGDPAADVSVPSSGT